MQEHDAINALSCLGCGTAIEDSGPAECYGSDAMGLLCNRCSDRPAKNPDLITSIERFPNGNVL